MSKKLNSSFSQSKSSCRGSVESCNISGSPEVLHYAGAVTVTPYSHAPFYNAFLCWSTSCLLAETIMDVQHINKCSTGIVRGAGGGVEGENGNNVVMPVE